MVRKKLAIAILALSALQANVAGAMGLGNLSIKSALNQPLSAEIKLLDTGDLDSSQIKIQLAAPEDFQRAGVDRDFFLTNLRFSVDMDGHGGGTIQVTTRGPVVEPYLNFVLEARWPNGRLLREFAVLLDPPTFSANKAAVPVAPATSAGVQTAKPRAVQPPVVKTETETTTTVPPADMSLPAAGKPGEYRIQVYDTLSKIAARFKPASDVSVAQTMIAIQRANPQVFLRNNVNLIKSGYVLRLPSADEARAIATDQAAQEVDAQMQDWRGSRSSGSTGARAPAAGPQLDASTPEPSKKEAGFREQARLSIATAGETDKNTAGGGGSGKGLEALRKQLTESQESLEKGKRDNKELQSRLDDMERQIATLQRLISLKDDQLAALQTKSASAKPAPQPAPEVEKPAPAPTATEPAAAVAPTTPAPASEVGAPTPPSAPAPVEPKPLPKPAVPATQPSSFDQLVAYRDYYLYGGIAAVVAALGIPMLIKRQRRKAWAQREAESDTLSFDADDDFQFDTATFDDSHGEGAGAEAEVTTERAEQPEAPKNGVRSETGDPIAESDIYIAYGRYQQAVDLLTNAIDAEPNRSDLRVKLLEVYIEMRNKEAFGQQFVALQSLGDSDAIARVKDLLSSVDGIADWLNDLPLGANASSVTANTSSFTPSVATAAIAASVASAAPDLDLDFGNESVTSEPAAPKAELDASVSDDLASLESSFMGKEEPAEFDLNLDLDDELVSDGTGANISEDFPNKQEPASSFGSTSFDTSDFQTPDFETRGLEPAKTDDNGSDDNSSTAFEEDGLELDLGDDDLDQALSRMDDTENLGDLEAMSTALGDRDTQPVPAPVDLSADVGELSDEFDLSQAGVELPEPDRANGSDFGDLSFDEPDFEEPSFESSPAPQPEIDVFAGLSQPSPSPMSAPEQPVAPAPTLDSGDDFDFLADADEVATKLDLARAYIDMGDTDGAKDILDEVLQEGTDTQKQEASTLLSRMG